jgi:hypothetical protein
MANTTIYVDPSVADDSGDGSMARPFKYLATAVLAVPEFPMGQDGHLDTTVGGTIMLARGLYNPADAAGNQWVYYQNKRITFIGQALYNESPDPPTHEVFVAPSFTDGGGYVEFQKTNCGVQPMTSDGGLLSVVGRDAFVEAWGMLPANYFLSGNPKTTRMGQKVHFLGPIGSIHASDALIDADPFGGSVDLTACLLEAEQLVLSNASGASFLNRCTFNNGAVTTAHPLTLTACLFLRPVTFATTGAGSIITDYLTYVRGLAVGSTFPAATTILDQCVSTQLMPTFVAAGAGVNSTGDLTLSYPDNAAGDLFIAQLNCAGGTSVPNTPSGWTLQYSKANAGIVGYVYTRVARSTGGEAGTVTWSMPTDGAPKQGSIYSFRNVATSSFIESETDFSNTLGVGQGPTITPAGSGRLACVFFASNYDAPLTDPITGNTGGTWQFRFAQYSGIYALLQLQTAELTANTTISGGSCSLGGGTFKVAGIAFALVGATS